jgi:hypothetical protein
MSAFGNSRTFFHRIIEVCTTLLLCVLSVGIANADVILGIQSNIEPNYATFQPIQAVKPNPITAKLSPKEVYIRFIQDSVDNGGPALSVLTAFGKEEKSVEYVQSKHFRYYVMPNSRENPSERERIALSHHASGTQSRMLVMTK